MISTYALDLGVAYARDLAGGVLGVPAVVDLHGWLSSWLFGALHPSATIML
jgi:hypothetical protein